MGYKRGCNPGEMVDAFLVQNARLGAAGFLAVMAALCKRSLGRQHMQ